MADLQTRDRTGEWWMTCKILDRTDSGLVADLQTLDRTPDWGQIAYYYLKVFLFYILFISIFQAPLSVVSVATPTNLSV